VNLFRVGTVVLWHLLQLVEQVLQAQATIKGKRDSDGT
jgi:hypothetical protein